MWKFREMNQVVYLGLLLAILACSEKNDPNGVQPDPDDTDVEQTTDEESPDGAYELLKSKKSRIANPSPSESTLGELTASNTAFAFDMYAQLREGNDANLFYSPFSLSVGLAMSYGGARGTTETEMADAMHFTSLDQESLHEAFNQTLRALESREAPEDDADDSGFELVIANSFWAQKGFPFLSEYLDLLSSNYGAGIRTVDFQANLAESVEAVNNWIADSTADKITDMLNPDELTPPIYSMLVNAIYFKAAWDLPFDAENTAKKEFTLLSGETTEVDMMSQGEHFSYGKGEGYEAVSLRYDGDKLDMVLIAPDVGTFTAFEETLDSNKIETILESMASRYSTWVTLSIPKFDISSRWELRDRFMALGMNAPFSDEADFSGMSEEFLRIQKIFHQTEISVDEAGTEAAAATVVVDSNGDADYAELNLNRPFIFLIRDIPTGTILFVGRVLDPSK